MKKVWLFKKQKKMSMKRKVINKTNIREEKDKY